VPPGSHGAEQVVRVPAAGLLGGSSPSDKTTNETLPGCGVTLILSIWTRMQVCLSDADGRLCEKNKKLSRHEKAQNILNEPPLPSLLSGFEKCD